jgi:hypothetical protein
VQKLTDHPAPARLGRFFRMLVGETQPADRDDVVDLTEGSPDLAQIELRLQRLERGVRSIADGLRQSHDKLRESIRVVEEEIRERDRVTRSEIQRMLWQALGPVAASIQQLSESLGSLPPAISEGDRIAMGGGSDGPWSLTDEPEEPARTVREHPTEELKDLPATPFDLD